MKADNKYFMIVVGLRELRANLEEAIISLEASCPLQAVAHIRKATSLIGETLYELYKLK